MYFFSKKFILGNKTHKKKKAKRGYYWKDILVESLRLKLIKIALIIEKTYRIHNPLVQKM